MPAQIENIEQMLDRITEATDGEREVSVGHIIETIGRRSFGPILLITGLVTLAPVGGIPGVPSVLAVLVFVVAAQLLLGRKSFWLPSWLLKRKYRGPR